MLSPLPISPERGIRCDGVLCEPRIWEAHFEANHLVSPFPAADGCCWPELYLVAKQNYLLPALPVDDRSALSAAARPRKTIQYIICRNRHQFCNPLARRSPWKFIQLPQHQVTLRNKTVRRKHYVFYNNANVRFVSYSAPMPCVHPPPPPFCARGSSLLCTWVRLHSIKNSSQLPLFFKRRHLTAKLCWHQSLNALEQYCAPSLGVYLNFIDARSLWEKRSQETILVVGIL